MRPPPATPALESAAPTAIDPQPFPRKKSLQPLEKLRYPRRHDDQEALPHFPRPDRRAAPLLKKTIISEAFVDIGLAFVEIEKNALYKALGHATFGELLTERGVIGPSQAFKLMAIARALPKRHALALGTEKAYALVRYAKATAKIDFASQLVEKGVPIAGKLRALADLSAAELNREALRTSRNRKNATRDPERHAALATVEEGRTRLGKRGLQAKTAVHKSRGRWIVTVEMRVEDFAALR